MPWTSQWTIKVDGTELNDIRTFATTIPELENMPPMRTVMVDRDGDYPVYIRSQPQAGQYTFLIAMANADIPAWNSRLATLKALFAQSAYHTLVAQVRGMPSPVTVQFVTEAMQTDFKSRTVVVYTTAPRPVLA